MNRYSSRHAGQKGNDMHAITIDTLTIALQSTGHTVEWPVTGHLILDGTVIERQVYQDIVRYADDVRHAVELLAHVAGGAS